MPHRSRLVLVEIVRCFERLSQLLLAVYRGTQDLLAAIDDLRNAIEKISQEVLGEPRVAFADSRIGARARHCHHSRKDSGSKSLYLSSLSARGIIQRPRNVSNKSCADV